MSENLYTLKGYAKYQVKNRALERTCNRFLDFAETTLNDYYKKYVGLIEFQKDLISKFKFNTTAFSLLVTAARKSRHELWQALQVLIFITLCLDIVFYIAESSAQPDEYGNIWRCIIWSLTQYIGDPGEFAGPGPETYMGRLVATSLGILNILVFAVPAGMIGSRFSEAITEENERKRREKTCQTIRNSFKRILCRHTGYRCTPGYISLIDLQVELGLDSSDIISSINSPSGIDMRLRNLAKTYDIASNDRLIVELFPLTGKTQDGYEMKQKKYGCMIDRGSKVTIVCPSSFHSEEILDSHFGYYLSQYGGFNYMSKEFDIVNNSYYTVSDDIIENEKNHIKNIENKAYTENIITPYQEFFEDLKRFSREEDSWVIFILQITREISSDLNFIHSLSPKTQTILNRKTTIIEDKEQVFLNAYNAITDALECGGSVGYRTSPGEKEFDNINKLSASLDENFKPVGKRNIAAIIGGGISTNAFTLRVSSKLITRDRRDIPIAAMLAEKFRIFFESNKDFDIKENERIWSERGIGY